MKRIFFNRNGRVAKPPFPFWQPWGCMGCLWRVLVFLLGAVLIALLISLLTKGCEKSSDPDDLSEYFDDDLPDDGPVRDEPYKPITDLPPELTDDTPVDDWNDSIPGVDELPDPRDNILPPVDSTKVKPNPTDSLELIVADQIIVLFNSKDIKSDMASFARQFKKAYPNPTDTIIYYNPKTGVMLLQVPEDELFDRLTDIPRQVTGIDYKLTTNPLLNLEKTPTDPAFAMADYKRYFDAIQAFDAWDITRGSSDVVVGIVDTYFCLDNPEINTNYIKPIHIPTKTRNVLPRSVPTPPFRNEKEADAFGSACHGTHVAGIAVGQHDNGAGAGGIAPQCKWIPISVGDRVPSVYLMEGILYAVYQGADVVNVSMGNHFPKNTDKRVPASEQARRTRETFPFLEDAWEFVYKTACDHNCVICTAAGNDNLIMGMDAAKRSPLVVKVEATTSNGKSRADFSNYGTVPSLDMELSTVSAPGKGILSGIAWGKFCLMDGTSQATPFVTGAVALLKSVKKDITPAQVIDVLQRTGKPLPASNKVGPLIQIRDALQLVADGGVEDTLMVYDEVVDDHDNLKGRWMGTTEQIMTDGKTGEELDVLQTYMEFTSATQGFVEFRAKTLGRIYRAPLVVAWGKGTVTIKQQGPAVCTTDATDKITPYDYVCRPDAKGLLEVSVMEGGKERLKFNMRKIR